MATATSDEARITPVQRAIAFACARSNTVQPAFLPSFPVFDFALLHGDSSFMASSCSAVREVWLPMAADDGGRTGGRADDGVGRQLCEEFETSALQYSEVMRCDGGRSEGRARSSSSRRRSGPS